MKNNITPTVVLLISTTLAVIGARIMEMNPPTINIIGAYASVIAIFALGSLFKLPYGYYCLALIFDFFATSVGSVLNVYRTWDPYDLIVHYMSGIMLAALGILLIRYIYKGCGFGAGHRLRLETPSILFSFFFSAAGAGLWEIYEFAMDSMTGGNMQGGNSNTMGDVIAGFGGALTFAIFMICWRGMTRRR